MRTRCLFAIAIALLATLTLGQAQGGKTLRWDLQDERFKGLTMEVPAPFVQTGAKKLDFPFTLRLINNRAEPVTLRKWELRANAVSLGQNKGESEELAARSITLAPGEAQEISGHFYLGTGGGKALGIGLGKSKSAKDITIDRLHGDALAGLVMTIGTSAKEEVSLYLAKYHYDESADTVSVYYCPAR